MKTRGLKRSPHSDTRNAASAAGFTLVEVMVAVAIIALTAVLLLGRQSEVIGDTARARDVRTSWVLASQKLAELELNNTLWLGDGGSSSGDFGDVDPKFAAFTWEYVATRELVDTSLPGQEPPATPPKPKEIFRVGFKVDGPSLTEPILIEAMFPLPTPPSGPASPNNPADPNAPASTGQPNAPALPAGPQGVKK